MFEQNMKLSSEKDLLEQSLKAENEKIGKKENESEEQVEQEKLKNTQVADSLKLANCCLDCAKKRDMDDKSQIMELKEKVDKLENQLAEKDKALEIMGEKIAKLETEKGRLQQNVEVAHITIAKNLEKIQKLEARNNCSDNENSSEVELVQKTKLKEDLSLKMENTKDISLKEEYMENLKDFSLKEEYMEITKEFSLKVEPLEDTKDLGMKVEPVQDTKDVSLKVDTANILNKFLKEDTDNKTANILEKYEFLTDVAEPKGDGVGGLPPPPPSLVIPLPPQESQLYSGVYSPSRATSPHSDDEVVDLARAKKSSSHPPPPSELTLTRPAQCIIAKMTSPLTKSHSHCGVMPDQVEFGSLKSSGAKGYLHIKYSCIYI